MIIFNGKKYAKNNDEFLNSLFEAGGTCNGFYKKLKKGIRIFNMQHELMAFIVNNGYNERFVVSARLTDTNKPRYLFSLTDSDECYLGLDKVGYREKIEECERVINKYCNQGA